MKAGQVWVPCQVSSTRVQQKNIRKFYDEDSLLDIKLKQLLQCFSSDQIYVSSEGSAVANICRKYSVNFIQRPTHLTGNKIYQKDLIQHFAENTVGCEFVYWVQVTDPFFDEFNEFSNFCQTIDGSACVCTKLQKHAVYQGHPVNFLYGDWHKVTQDINPILIPRWSAFFNPRDVLLEVGYQFGLKQNWFYTNKPMVDIDTQDDFDFAQDLWAMRVR